MIAQGFWYDAHGTLRAPWRLAIFFIVSAVAAILSSSLATGMFGLGPASAAQPFGRTVLITAGLLALVVAHVVCVRLVDRAPWSSIGLGSADARPSLLASGTILGALAIGVPGAMLLAAGWLDVVPGSPGSWWGTALNMAVLFLPAALFEELLFRGYPFAVLRSAVNPVFALFATSAAFALVHMSNQTVMADTSALPQGIFAVFLAGLLLGSIVLVTGSVYAAWTAHFAWNFVLGGVMHSPVSGISDPVADYRVIDGGPDWATGGGWGPEGGVAAMAGMLAATAILYSYSRRARRLEAPRESRQGESGA